MSTVKPIQGGSRVTIDRGGEIPIEGINLGGYFNDDGTLYYVVELDSGLIEEYDAPRVTKDPSVSDGLKP